MRQSKWITVLLFIILLAGLSLLLYPSFSAYWNSMHQSREIASYAEVAAGYSQEEFQKMWDAAVEYNRALAARGGVQLLSEEQLEEYMSLLNLAAGGIMGYVEVPSVKIELPMYHGTGDVELQRGVGHIDWSSLPVGGESSHSVLSSHRGLPSARLFTDLDKVLVGDVILLHVLDRKLTYEVDQIVTVLPDNVEELGISAAADYCTLVTCTPYGVNTHRLLVRGHRVPNPEELEVPRVVSEAIQLKPIVVAPVLAAPMLLALFIVMMAESTIREKQRRKQNS